jgi:6-phosphofructokinase
MEKMNAFYAQSGGVTAVINATACGVIETARRYKTRIGKVYAGRDGIIGALTEDLIDTSKESPAAIRALRYTPAGAFGSCRYKIKSFEENRAPYERLIEVFKAHNIGYFFYNGGNDSADTAYKVSQVSEKLGYPVLCIGIPKTVDNDLVVTDCCPGFGSVAKYVAVSIREAGFDVASMARTSTKVFVLEVMGRHAGWIALESGIAGGADAILIPELPADPDRVVAYLREREARGRHSAIVVVSEGVRLGEGTATAARDEFGHEALAAVGVGERLARYIAEATGKEARAVVLGHLQRGGTPTAFDRALATRYGIHAARMVDQGAFGRMAALRGAEIIDIPIDDAVGTLKTVPPELFADAEVFFG